MSDHQDAHLAKLHPECDIGDFWVFHHGVGADARVVFVMTLNAGNVGMVHYGPVGNRNARLFTTVPKRFRSRLRRAHSDLEWAGPLVLGDHRRFLTAGLRFHPNAVYEFRIAVPDASGTLQPRLSFKIVVDGEGGFAENRDEPRRQTMQLLRADQRDGDHVERGDRSGTEIPFAEAATIDHAADPQDVPTVHTVPWYGETQRPVQLYAGPRQDPFTFDFEGVRTQLAHQYRKELCSGGAPSGGNSDAFSRAFNISAIVLEVPIQAILADEEIAANTTFAAWSATTLDGHPINRAGWPLFKPTFLPKEYFEQILDPTNGTKLARQTEVLTPLLVEELNRLGVTPDTRDALIDLVVPDAVPVDVSRPPGLMQTPPNGRTLDATGDPAKFFVSSVDPGTYPVPGVTGPRPGLTALDAFPYLTAPSADPASSGSTGWTDYTPIPDPPWPTRTDDWREPTSADEYLDGLLDPALRQAPPRPERVA